MYICNKRHFRKRESAVLGVKFHAAGASFARSLSPRQNIAPPRAVTFFYSRRDRENARRSFF